MASVAGYPKMTSAAWFQNTMRPSAPTAIAASGASCQNLCANPSSSRYPLVRAVIRAYPSLFYDLNPTIVGIPTGVDVAWQKGTRGCTAPRGAVASSWVHPHRSISYKCFTGSPYPVQRSRKADTGPSTVDSGYSMRSLRPCSFSRDGWDNRGESVKFIDCADFREGTSVAPHEVYDQLRDTFYARLGNERARLADLATMLAQSTSDSTSVFEKLKLFAHRLRGDSTTFRFLEIAKAATALELAATSASLRHADNTDASVRLMIDVLADRLASVEARDEQCPRTVHASR
jgi:hypothetical protein